MFNNYRGNNRQNPFITNQVLLENYRICHSTHSNLSSVGLLMKFQGMFLKLWRKSITTLNQPSVLLKSPGVV